MRPADGRVRAWLFAGLLRAFPRLRLAQERYELILAGGDVGIWDWNLVDNRLFMSPRAQELVGLQPQAPHERAWSDWQTQPSYHPDDWPRRQAAMRQHLEDRTPRYEGEWRIRQRDGTYRWVQARGTCVRDAQGRPTRFSGTATDITARKATEEALRLSEERHVRAMAATEDGHWDWNVATDEVFISGAMNQICGFLPERHFATRDAFMQAMPYHPDDVAHIRSESQRGLAGPGERHQFDYRILRAPGDEVRWLRALWLITRDADGTARRVTGRLTDITDRRAAEAALRDSEERFALAVAGSTDGIFDWDLRSGRMYLSDRAQRIYGLEPGPNVRQRSEWAAMVRTHADDLARQRHLEAHYLEGNPAQQADYDAEWRVHHRDGSTRWVRIRGTAIRDAEGRPTRFTGSLTDIDTRKRAEDALRLSEERYALAMQATGAGHWDWIVDGDRFYASPQLLALCGLPADTLFTRRDDFLASFPVHPDDLARWRDERAAHFAGTGVRFQMDLRLVPRGEVRWFHMIGLSSRDAHGRVTRWTGSIHDMTERRRVEEALRQSEQRYALAMEEAAAGHTDWIVATDEFYASPRALQIWGLPEDTVFSGRADCLRSVPFDPEDRRVWVDAVKEHFAHGSGRLEREVRIYPNGELRWVLFSGMCKRDAEGRPARWVGSIVDITDRRRLERQLRQAQRLEAIGTLAGGIAHDFNNILGAILGYGEMALRDAPAGSRLRRDIGNIVAAGERGRALVDRVLAFSRSGLGERVAVHVERVTREALEMLVPGLPQGVVLHTSFHAGRAAVMGDPIQVHQVLLNLVTNAAQAMPEGGELRVSLDVSRLEHERVVTTGGLPPGDYVVLEVADTGPGIAADVVERIFDPFFTTKEVGVGTGLGLSLVHGIVAEVGGAIEVASASGCGAAFTVYLPRAGDAGDAGDEHEDSLATLPRGSWQRILVVDDEAALVQLATRTLTELGYEPVGFTSSEQALQAFTADPAGFDAVITDERMPGLSGSALIGRLRRLRRDLPILLVSGYVGGGIVAGAYNAGADEVLKKPLAARELATALARLLHL